MREITLRNRNWLLVFALFAMQFVVNSQIIAQDESATSLRALAMEAYEQGNFEEAVAAFSKVVELEPDNGRDWHLLGYCQHSKGDLDDAIKSHLKATEFASFKAISLYNLGCAYSLKKDADKSFDYLNQALKAGFDQTQMLDSDSDLDNIRKDPRFKKLVAFANGEDEPEVKKGKFDAAGLIGQWKMIAGQRGGEDVPSERMPPEIEISKTAFTLPSPDGSEPFVMGFKIDASKDPLEIDFDIESGPVPSGQALGIFKVKGDKMTLCYDGMTGKRPEKFETTEEDGYFMFVMRKVAKAAPLTLEGKWSFESGVRAGEDVDKARLATTIEVDKDTITLPAGPDQTFVMSYKIDAKASPMTIDMKIESGPAPEGSPAIGIVEIKDDSFTICYDSTGATRPEKFETDAENGFFMFKLKRAKE